MAAPLQAILDITMEMFELVRLPDLLLQHYVDFVAAV